MKHQKKHKNIPSPEELFTEYAPLIFKVASGHLQSAEDCRECVNDTFLEFYKHPERYDPEKGSLAAYLSAIAGKKAISKWRRNRHSGEVSSVSPDVGITEDPAERITSQMDLEKALSSLEEEELRLIRLRYYQGLSIQEIASDMQLSYEAVKKRHQRTLKKLRLLLLIIAILGVLAGCAFFLAKKAGIIPGYGAVTEDAGAVYCLEAPVSVPIPGTEWEARITTAVYQEDYLSVRYHLTDREGRMLSDRELGSYYERKGENVWENNYCVGSSVESYLYIGPGHYEEFDPFEVTYIGNSGPEYFDNWLKAYDGSRMENRENGDIYRIHEPVWSHKSLPAVLKDGENITFTFASDIVTMEQENGLIWKNELEYDTWIRTLSEIRHRFEVTLTLRAVFPEQIDEYSCDYNEEDGGVLAIPRLEDGHLIVAIYPLQGSHGKIAAGLVHTNSYIGTAEDPEIGTVTVTAEDGTVLIGTLLDQTQSDAELYSEWDFGLAEPGSYQLQIPYLLKIYDGGDELQKVWIPFSIKRGTVSSRSVMLDGIQIRASNLQPLAWEDLLLGSSPEARSYYQIKETPFYIDTDRLWSIDLETKAPSPEETVVDVSVGLTHKNAWFFSISGDCTGIFRYDLPQNGRLKYFFCWQDAANRLYANPMDTWAFHFYTMSVEQYPTVWSGITTRWEHPVELTFTVE